MSRLSVGRALSLSPQILELLALPCCLEEPEADGRPSISDDLKVGYFITDHATQTDLKETIELKELTTTTKALVQLTDSIQQDFMIYKNVLQAQYEEKIQEQASNLYRLINERLRDMETFHKQKEVKIRQSYQQQLCDALAILRVHYEKTMYIPEDASCSLTMNWQAMIMKLQEKDSTIQKLEAELQEYQENEDTKTIAFDNDDENEKKVLEKENKDFREEIAKLLDRILHLEESLKHGEKENHKLDKEVRGMQLKMEKDEKTIQKLIEAQEITKMELEKERSLIQSMLKEQKSIETKVGKKSPETQKKIPTLQEKDTQKMKEMVESKSEMTEPHEKKESRKGYHKQPQKKSPSYKKEAEKRALLAEIEKLRLSEDQERQHIQSLKKQVEQINQSWAKKFQILKKSLHAIKDEMFLRHSLYRQAAAFNQASLNQTIALPLYIETGTSQMTERRGALYFPYSPLPQIPSQSTAEMEEKDLNIVKIPTGTDMCSLYEDVLPLIHTSTSKTYILFWKCSLSSQKYKSTSLK
nr:uncharacterized protein C10orf67 homolog, mitochondrial [Pelodiscus sinensis]|eukprot:XP_025038630.1 uncharacterized protein C10orf67 homolog, mitochondrial [Pelodiscus sinensis]